MSLSRVTFSIPSVTTDNSELTFLDLQLVMRIRLHVTNTTITLVGGRRVDNPIARRLPPLRPGLVAAARKDLPRLKSCGSSTHGGNIGAIV
mmetsp:Transcript_51371/g.133490  ORF Transcript_51371/g.133490 Transcript_51371/m.133490 type:complete len:91 (+) Transcript_51371:371-643(+)